LTLVTKNDNIDYTGTIYLKRHIFKIKLVKENT